MNNILPPPKTPLEAFLTQIQTKLKTYQRCKTYNDCKRIKPRFFIITVVFMLLGRFKTFQPDTEGCNFEFHH